MPTINHQITITIRGTDRTTLLLNESLYIRTAIGNASDSASFELLDTTGAFIPLDWDEVSIAVNATDVFGGYITSREAHGIGDGSNKAAVWSIECRDWSALLDSVIVDYGYTDTADSDIVDDLFTRYLSAEGFDSTTSVDTVNADVDITFENITVREALNQLAAVAQARWHIAPDKSLYWYSPTAPAAAEFDIDVVSPNGSTTFDVLAESLQHSIDASTIVNRVRIFGGEEPGIATTETFAADGSKDTFGPLASKPASFWRVNYTVGAAGQTAWASAIGYEPGDKLIADGGDYEVIVNLDNRYVKITTSAGAVPDNATNVEIEYFALTPVEVTVNSAPSQAEYNRVFEQSVYDSSLTSSVLAQQYGDRVISEYAYGRETITFDVTEHGLLPGRLIQVNAPVLDIDSTYDDAIALENRVDVILLEDGASRLMLENDGDAKQYIIQDVTIRAVTTGQDIFMVVASVTCGKYVTTLIDSLLGIAPFAGGVGPLPAQRIVGRLDRLGNNLGEIVAGRAVFTDGGTAPFTWDAYNDHTGAVIGLEDNTTTLRGAVYVLQDGTVQAKLGYLTGLPVTSGGTPTGWGIYTQNGFFSGFIAASQMIGGTIATTNPPINSSNPGVYMDSTGLWGYGTLGLTFSIPTNPASRPFFSSGTITNTVYEVTTAAVLRTGTANPRVQIDNSGIFAYDSGGTARFTVNASTGRLTASQGTFSGTVSASVLTGGTVSGGTVTGALVTAGTVSGNLVSGGTVSGSLVSGGTVSGALVTGGTVSAGGGTAILDSNGLAFTLPSGTALVTQTNLLWKRSGTNVVKLGGRYDSTYDYLWIEAGVSASKKGEIRKIALGTASSEYTMSRQDDNSFDYFINSGAGVRSVFGMQSGEVYIYQDLTPYETYNTVSLGKDTLPFSNLYLRGEDANIYRVYVNSSGVLTADVA